MLNLFHRSLTANYNKMECDGLLFVEYKCIPDENEIDALWSPCSHFVYVTSGIKTWLTPEGKVPVTRGEAVYCTKGACLMQNNYESAFCALIFFFPAEFLKEVALEFRDALSDAPVPEPQQFHLLKLEMDENLTIFFESVSSYFFQHRAPSRHLVKLKFKELVLQIMTSGNNVTLKAHLLSVIKAEKESIDAVMRKNLFFNLSIADYANLCNRSLSSFKRDFKEFYGVTPVQWILEERLKYARTRLLTTNESVADIAFYSGFESVSHFIRCFKTRYGAPPQKFRMTMTV